MKPAMTPLSTLEKTYALREGLSMISHLKPILNYESRTTLGRNRHFDIDTRAYYIRNLSML